jgi:translation initiation factor 3 subunit I
MAAKGSLQGVKLNSLLLPIVMHGHERSVTSLKYNRDGDLLFSSSKDKSPCVWYSATGERLGTYEPHGGSVWDIDPSFDSKYVLTAGADFVARVFKCETGKLLFQMPHRGVVRCVAWSETNNVFATASDPEHSRSPGLVNIFDYPTDEEIHEGLLPRLMIPIEGTQIKVRCMAWGPANEYIIVGQDDGKLVKFCPNTGDLLQVVQAHTKKINCLNFNQEKTLLITGSDDTDAKLWNAMTLECLTVYGTDRPVNGAVLSDKLPHVILGGGQDAMTVTTTKADSGKFEARFFHAIYGQEFGRVGGHFGPINAIAIHPQGTSYTSGAEDGYVLVPPVAPFL